MTRSFFARLRYLKVVADLGDVPPFVVFHDRSLKEMAKYYPRTGVAFLQVYGVSEGKTASAMAGCSLTPSTNTALKRESRRAPPRVMWFRVKRHRFDLNSMS